MNRFLPAAALMALMVVDVVACAETIRVATFNVSMYRDKAGMLATELAGGKSKQASDLAAIIQTMRPDILLLNEFDYEHDAKSLKLFLEGFVSNPQKGLEPIGYEHYFIAPSNTGEQSGFDFDHDGQSNTPGDAWGFGRYPGQYGMALVSRFPIDKDAVRTFRKFKWSQMPNARRPIDPATGKSWYTNQEWAAIRLSSKSHWDVTVTVPGLGRLHLLASHPTPPSFDGPEDRNGCRNHDEIRIWADYLSGEKGAYLVDDAGKQGPLADDAKFVVVGDLNCDPIDGKTRPAGIKLLLNHPGVAAEPTPTSKGAVETASRNATLNAQQKANAAHDTSDFSRDGIGNLRVDYALPSSNLEVVRSGVFWPTAGERGADWVKATDHRMVWVDIELSSDPATRSECQTSASR